MGQAGVKLILWLRIDLKFLILLPPLPESKSCFSCMNNHWVCPMLETLRLLNDL